MSNPHISVLLDQVIESFREKKLSIFVDGTVGAGGHAAAILQSHPELTRYIGIDQDPDALTIANSKLAPWKNKVSLMLGNFSQIEQLLGDFGIQGVDGFLLDLGVSSMQLDRPERGFSFSKEGPLDMRMDPNQKLTAKEIVNTWTEQELGRIFRDFGEEKRWRLAAKTIVRARGKESLETTLDLARILEPHFSPRGKKGIHPLTLIFQALRISVNSELERVEETIPKMIRLLNKGGRFAVITFHSLEDRIVKNAFRYAGSDKVETRGIGGVFISKEPVVKPVTRKPLTASEVEISSNPRSRSAKLRVIEKI